MADPRRENFELEKSVSLRDIDIQRQQTQVEGKRGVRDIEQQRQRGIEGVVNNALQRGIYRSGIRTKGENEINKIAAQSTGDLRGDIDRALAQLSNRRRGVAGRQYTGDLDGSSSGLGFATDLKYWIDLFTGQEDNNIEDLPEEARMSASDRLIQKMMEGFVQ